MLMRLFLLYIFSFRLLAADCSSSAKPLSAKAQESTKLYVRHITQCLPAPTMLVGGKSVDPGVEKVKCRPTLHWSLLGFEPPMASIYVSQIDGKITSHQITFDEKKYRYAILEKLDVLGSKIIGGTPDDIYTLGTHTPSEHSYIIVPQNELTLIDKNIYKGKLISYDNEVINVKEAIRTVIENEQLLENWLTLVSISQNDLPSLRKEFSFVAEMVKDQKDHGLIESLTKEDLENGIRTGVLDKPHWYRSHKHEEDTITFKTFPMKIENSDYITILVVVKNEDRKIFYNRFFIDGSGKKFDNTIIFKNAHVMNFRSVFDACSAPPELIHVCHQSSGLYDLEIAIMRIFATLREMAENFVLLSSHSLAEVKRDFKQRLKVQFSSLLAEKLQKIPSQHHEQLRRFFTDAFNERADKLVDEHLSFRTIETKEIDTSVHDERVFTTAITVTVERGLPTASDS